MHKIFLTLLHFSFASVLLILPIQTARAEIRTTILPFAAYSAETSLQMGGLVVFIKPGEKEQRSSAFDIAAFYTLNQQSRLILSPNFWFGPHWNLQGGITWEDWPAHFYGIGPGSLETDQSTYETKGVTLEMTLTRWWNQRFFAGIKEQWDYRRLHTDSTFWLIPGTTPDSKVFQSGGALQLGPVLGIDTRDNENWPTRGYLAELRLLGAHKSMPGNYSFTNTQLHLSGFFSLWKDLIWAGKAGGEFLSGTAPFYLLPSPDGVKEIRGIEKGRFRDQHFIWGQSEFRLPLFWRFSGTLFQEIGQVAPALSEFGHSEIVYSIGAGLRMALDAKEKLHGRGDLSWTDGGLGLTIYLREAF